MSTSNYFQTEKELISAAHAIAELMEQWGFAPNEWLLGKDLSLYFLGVFDQPSQIERDLTMFVLKEKIPWPVTDFRRSIVPPKGTKYAEEYHQLEDQLGAGFDLKPLPDGVASDRYITEVAFSSIGGRSINLETPRKYVERRYDLTQWLVDQPIQAARDFYFVTEARYQRRLADYDRLRRWALVNEPLLVPEIDRLVAVYNQVIQRCFPELFTSEAPALVTEVTGVSATPSASAFRGEVVVVDGTSTPPADRILVFPYFRPLDNSLAKTARAVIVDGGGRLSHAAIVCREFGVPCIVNTNSGSKVFQTGDQVEVDMTSGIVRKVVA